MPVPVGVDGSPTLLQSSVTLRNDRCVGKVYMDEDGFSVDGASGLRMVVSKYLSKAVRKWEQSLPDPPDGRTAPRPGRLHLSVAQAGNQLQIAVPDP